MYLGYLSFAEIEIVNEARLHAYRAAMDFPSTCELECATLRTSLEHAPYTTPAADNAPWYDPALPESGDVAGFQLLSVDGLGSSLSRDFKAASRGVSIGTITPTPRQLVLRFAALAKNKCATDYAVQWLLKTLAGLQCNEPAYPNRPNRACGGDDMCYFTCCPTGPADVPARLMTMFKVGLIGSSIVDEQDIYGCAGQLCEVEVTLAADPYIWRTPFVSLDTEVNELFYLGEEARFFPGLCGVAECAIPEPPGCSPITVLSPEIPPSPCVGGIPSGDLQLINMNHYVGVLDLTGVSKKLLSAPIIRWAATPDADTDVPIMFGLSRNEDAIANPCQMSANYFVPAYFSTEEFVLDTRVSSAYQDPSGCALFVTDYDLAPTSWDRLACASQMYIHVWINTLTDSRAGRLTVSFATEFTAGC